MSEQKLIHGLRKELLSLIERKLTPIAKKYDYSEVNLETQVKWRPLVLVIGNYSSGKSTLINELIGYKVQSTGQAPTDDSFTVITSDESNSTKEVTEKDGRYLLNNESYPFNLLKKHGQKFASHFKLKQVNSPVLQNLAIIDTPGMLDSISERDRGYNYQAVIGDLASIADLVIVMFDPHKAGTIRETHESLRKTIPKATFEDRVLFVLNRVDECASLTDFLRVYGSLCWNLSQMLGKKDIPMIHLTYSKEAARGLDKEKEYLLSNLEDQREELKNTIFSAPKYRLDHMASYVETQSEKLSHMLEGIKSYASRKKKKVLKVWLLSIMVSIFGGLAASGYLFYREELNFSYFQNALIGSVAFCVLFVCLLLIKPIVIRRFHKNQIKNIDKLTLLDTQSRKDSWEFVKEKVFDYLSSNHNKLKFSIIKSDFKDIKIVQVQGAKKIREQLSNLTMSSKGVNLVDNLDNRKNKMKVF